MPAAWESLFDGSLTLSDAQTESNALAELPARRGVLLFTDDSARPIQLVQTANLRSLSRSRLTDTEDAPRRKADLGAITKRIFYACCDNDLQRHVLYQRLTHAVFGKDWKKWLALPRRDYVALDRTRAFPFFAVTGAVETSGQTDVFGPFPTRRAAAQFCECLNTAFELCRNPGLLDSGKAKSCPYRQMQSCHGLCCREQGEQAYSEHVQKAQHCAAGKVAEGIAHIEQQMRQAATELNFESAQRLKKQADRLRELCRPDFAWTGRLTDFCAVVIDRGPNTVPEGEKKKVQQYQAWRIDAAGVYLLGAFTTETTDVLQQLVQAAAQQPTTAPPYPYALNRQEHLATIGYFLYRKSRPGLWYNAAAALPAAERIITDLETAAQSYH